jgi:Subtilase family/Secretion system C-terminal sorting domain
MNKHVLRLAVLIAALFICVSAIAELPQTDVEGLDALAERLAARYSALQGPEYDRLKAIRTGYWGELNADPERELVGVDEDGVPIILYTDNINAARSTGVDELHPGGLSGYDLTGATAWGLAVWDNGIANPSHPEWGGRAIPGDNSTTYASHANHTAGTLAAAGVNANAKGMSSGAFLTTFDWGMDQQEMAENGDWLKVSSHSYHSGGDYDTYSWLTADFDEIAYLAPNYLICQAAANDGPGYHTIPSSNLGKNVLTVGAVNDIANYDGPGSVSIAGFSSRGPTADGRLKPDIVGNGVSLYSTLSTGYTSMSGTSMSTPNVAGSLFLLVEHYQITHSYAPLLASTLKAVAIHTADECGGHDGPDYTFGWGLLNVRTAADLISDDVINEGRIQQNTLEEGQLFSYEFEADGTVPIRATIVWTEVQSSTGADPVLINDLDMRVVRVDNDEYWEPWVLNPESPSAAAFTGDNDLDNVEQVIVEGTTAGTYRVEIINDGPLDGDEQAFSLILDGVNAQQGVVLRLSPDVIDVDENGGVVTFDATINNYTDDSFTGLQFWTMATLPDGSDFGPLFTSPPFTLEPQGSISSPLMSQNVPGFAPNGEYRLSALVGVYPSVMASDFFVFSKEVVTSVDGDPVFDWDSHGSLGETSSVQPEMFVMDRAWPNPFNAETRVRVTLRTASTLQIHIYDVQGRSVATLADASYSAGRHEFTLTSDGLASGVYFIHATVDHGESTTQKLVLVQ